MPKTIARARCACGAVEIEAAGPPILAVACYCDDCQEGWARIEGARGALEPDGGSPYLVYRKDRFRCVSGASVLQAHKVREGSPTKRVVASCCNTAMFLGFDDARHWISACRGRFEGDLPPLRMRVCTKFKRAGVELPDDMPNHLMYAPGFLAKLLGARIAMLFGP
jgi:hypothetical protein